MCGKIEDNLRKKNENNIQDNIINSNDSNNNNSYESYNSDSNDDNNYDYNKKEKDQYLDRIFFIMLPTLINVRIWLNNLKMTNKLL